MSTGSYRRGMAACVCVVRSEIVCQKEGVEFAAIKKFRKVGPIFETIFVLGLVNGIPPLTGAW